MVDYEFDPISYTLFKNQKPIGTMHDRFGAIVDNSGVISYGFLKSDLSNFLNKKKLRNETYKLYDIDLSNIELINQLYIGFDLESYLINAEKKEPSAQYLECVNMFNEIVLTNSFKVERLIGYGFDSHDCYYITKDRYNVITHHTGVGGIVRLKGKIDGYERLESCFSYGKEADEFQFKLFSDSFYYLASCKQNMLQRKYESILYKTYKFLEKILYSK